MNGRPVNSYPPAYLIAHGCPIVCDNGASWFSYVVYPASDRSWFKPWRQVLK
jgi:hypothetical protein